MRNEKIIRQHFRKAFKDLDFTDDFMFRKVMYGNEDLCRRVIELLLDVKIKKIAYKDQDHVITATTDSKSVRLDVYVEDDEGTVIDLEMQNLKETPLPKRMRYYQSMIDVDNLMRGAKFEELPDSYIVFICSFDPHGRGMAKYEFRELCLQDSEIELKTGASKVFVNSKSKEKDMSEEMKAFLAYLRGEGASSGLTKEIDAGVAHVKSFRPWEAEYMLFSDMISLAEQDAHRVGLAEGRKEGRAEGRAEGRKEGRAEGRKEGRAEGRKEGRAEGRAEGRKEGRAEANYEDVEKLVSDGIADEERACSILGVDTEEYRAYLRAKAMR